MSKKSRTLYQLYSWNGGLLNYIILRAVLISHFLIDFYLPSTNTQLKLEGIPISLAILESLLIVFEVFEIVCRIILIIPSLEVEDTIFNIRNRAILIFLSLIFVVLICFDHITSLSIGFSFEFYIPLKIPLAIFLIDEVAVVLQAFFHSLRQATQVFLLYGCLLFVAALWGLLVFRDAINPETFKNSFGTFFRSLITAFIYMSSGENFTQVVFQSVEYNTIASIFSIIFELLLFHTDFLSIVFYFLTLTVLGTFFTLALMLSFFEEGFLSTFRSKLREKRLRKRLGLLSSFILMDIDHSGTVDLPEFRSFIQEINPLVTDEQVESIFRKLNVHESSKGRPTLSVLEFVVGVEKSSKLRISNSNFDVDRIRKDFNAQAAKMVNRSISQKVINPSKVHSNFMKDKKIVQLEGVEMSPVMSVDPPVLKSKPARRVRILASESSRLKARRWLFAVFSHPVYNHLILVTLFIYLCVVSLYGAVVEESILNYIAGSIMLIFVIEISLKIFVYGYAVSLFFT